MRKVKVKITRKIFSLRFLSLISMFVSGIFAVNFCFSNLVRAQTGGTFTIEKSVVASGGGTSSGGTFNTQGTAGQTVAGGFPQAASYSIHSGFWSPLAPSAASVSVSGRVLATDGIGLRNAVVVLTDSQGNTRTARTGSFGYYRFDEIEAGQTYIFAIRSKRFQFAAQVISVTENLEDLNFTAEF